jgi:L-rhamnose mutarotase
MSDQGAETLAFRMILRPGFEDEYQRRHDEIWPELAAELHDRGVVDYRIFLDEETGHLFAVLTRRLDHRLDDLASQPIMQRWWAMMADIMETEDDLSPRQASLREVFHLAAS